MNISEYLSRTMLIERMTGVILYATLLFIFYSKIQYSKSTNETKCLLRIYTFALCIMAFFYIPTETADLYRWRYLSEGWKNMTLTEFYNQYLCKVSSPVGYILIYFCRKTGIDGVLPTVCAFIFLYNTFYIIGHIYDDYPKTNNSKHEVFPFIGIGLLFLMCSGRFLETISGVRCMVAFSIIAKTIYCETMKERSLVKSIIPYLIACLLHNAALPLVAIRIVCILFERKKSVGMKIVNIACVFAIIIISLKYGDKYIDATVEKANGFIANNVYSYIWEYIIAGLQLFLIITILYNYYMFYKKSNSGVNSIARIITALTIIEIGLVKSYSIFHRFIGFSSFLIIPLLVYVLKEEAEQEKNICGKYFKPICILILVVSCLRGNLCAYKFFLL